MSRLEARMAELRARFRERAADARPKLQAAIKEADRGEMQRLAHGLAGSGGVFGFPEVSQDAQALEEALEDGAAPDIIEALAGRLLDSLEKAAQPG